MTKTKFNLDRKNVSSEHIHSRQDFQKVLNGSGALKPPIWKNPWFYGPAGLASLAILLGLTFQKQFDDKNNTLNVNENQLTQSFPDDTPCIQAVSSEIDPEFQIFKVSKQRGRTITLQSGTTIRIPANSLLSNSENDNVEFKIREFSDKSSIFLAGIPMDYGQKSAFESAGMIEIRAENGREEVKISTAYPLEVDLAMTKDPANFQFWRLDEQRKDWVDHPCVMKSNSRTNSKIDLNKELQKTKADIKKNLLETKSLEKIVNPTSGITDLSMLPSENARKLIVDFNPKDFPELKEFKDIEFEYVQDESRMDPQTHNKNIKYVQNQQWNDMQVKKAHEYYTVTFSNQREKVTLPVKPVLKGKSLAEFNANIEVSKINKQQMISEIEEKRKALDKEKLSLQLKQELILNDLKNSISSRMLISSTNIAPGTAIFTVNEFGVYNCDKPISYPTAFSSSTRFLDEAGQALKIKAAHVFDIVQDVQFSYGNLYRHALKDIGWTENENALIVFDSFDNVYFAEKSSNSPRTDENSVQLKRIQKEALTLSKVKKIIGEKLVSI